MKKSFIFLQIIGILLLSGCVTTANHSGSLIGETSRRRMVILGEHMDRDVVIEYANKYNATTFYTPSRGGMADIVSSSLRGTLGPSSAMRGLMKNLESMNNTQGEWELIIPKLGYNYFLVTLRNMKNGALANTKCTVRLIGVPENNEIEEETKRVGGIFLTTEYENAK